MSAPGLDPACLDLAEYVLEAELERTGTDPNTSTRVLSLATAIQTAIEAWHTAHAGEVEP